MIHHTSSISPYVLGRDLSNPDTGELCLNGLATDNFDANKIISGYYHSNSWINTPGPTGALISFTISGNIKNRYAIIQLFFSYSGPSSYRTTILGGMPSGTKPTDDDWAAWIPIGTPNP